MKGGAGGCEDRLMSSCCNQTVCCQQACVFAGVGFHDVYAASKFAIEGFCESLAVQLMMFNVKLVPLLFALMAREQDEA